VKSLRVSFAILLQSLWTVFRVLAITVVWIALFIATLLGYLTLPIMLLGAFLILYSAYAAVRVRGRR